MKKLGLAASTALLATTLNAQMVRVIPYTPKKIDKDILYLGNQKFGVRPLIGATIDFGYDGRPVRKLLNVPEEVRHVPIHPDDFYADEKNNGPIEPKDIKGVVMGKASLTASGGLEFKINNIYLLTAMNWTSTIVGNNSSKHYSRNYTNNPGSTQRGYGAALTVYRTSISPSMIKGLSAEILIPDKGESSWVDKQGLLIGYSLRKYTFNLETGWDRFDGYGRYQQFPVENIVENSVYLGFVGSDELNSEEKLGGRWRTAVRAGLHFYDYKRVDSYKDMQIKARGWSPFITVSSGLFF